MSWDDHLITTKINLVEDGSQCASLFKSFVIGICCHLIFLFPSALKPAMNTLIVFFVAFEISDILAMKINKKFKLEFFLHHLVHIIMGLLFIMNKQAHDVAHLILMQDSTGIFLSMIKLMKTRQVSGGKKLIFKLAFMMSFGFYRILVPLWAINLLKKNHSIPGNFKSYGLNLLCISYGFQVFWFYKIIMLACKHVRQFFNFKKK